MLRKPCGYFSSFFFVPRRSAYNADLSRGTATRSGRSIVATRYRIYSSVYVATIYIIFFFGRNVGVSSLMMNINFYKIYAHHNYSAHYGSVFYVKISGRSNLCEYGMMFRFVKFEKADEGEAHTQFWLAVIHVRKLVDTPQLCTVASAFGN